MSESIPHSDLPTFSSCQEQPKIIEPLDYEAVVFQRKAQIHNDPHRDLLLCPVDDVSVSTFVPVPLGLRLSQLDGAAAQEAASYPAADVNIPAIKPIIMRSSVW